MTLKQLRRAVAEGGGLCRLWLVYREDRHEIAAGQEARLRLVRAFWQQAEAVAWAASQHDARPAHVFHVYRVVVDEEWIDANTLRPVQYVASFHTTAAPAAVPAVTPGALAHAMG